MSNVTFNDVNSVLLNRVLIRLYEDVANINTQIHQVQADIQALVQAGHLTEEDAAFILSKVPLTTDPSVHAAASLKALTSSDSPPPPNSDSYLAPVHNMTTSVAPTGRELRRPVPKIPVANTFFQATAIWDYNTNNEHPEDLTLYAGDVIEVDSKSAEANADWWTGKVRGQTGLFPSSYVERIIHSLPPPAPAPKVRSSSRPGSEVSAPTYTPYRSTHVAMNPVGGGPNALGLQPVQQEDAKKGKYDHLKSTMANSAAGGVGFGAGAALAGGLVRAIF